MEATCPTLLAAAPEEPTCLAPKRHGAPCLRESLPGTPFPLCRVHIVEVLQYINERMAATQPAVRAIRAIERAEQRGSLETSADLIRLPSKGVAVIYYIRIGDHIKVGYSKNLPQRMIAYPPDAELLAYEPGDWVLEKHRHRQFQGDLRLNREWFAPSVDLLAHIEELRTTLIAA